MLKKGLLLGLMLALLLYPLISYAQEHNSNADSIDDTDDINDSELNAFGYPDKELVTIIESHINEPRKGQNVDMPDCNDPLLLEQIRANIAPLLATDDTSIRKRRRIHILMKNIKDFKELKSSEIDFKKDTAAADRLIEIKINNRKNNEDIKVCKLEKNIVELTFYVIMYYIDDKLAVELVNFASPNPVFVFEKQNMN